MNSEEGNSVFITETGRDSKTQGFVFDCWLHQQGGKINYIFEKI